MRQGTPPVKTRILPVRNDLAGPVRRAMVDPFDFGASIRAATSTAAIAWDADIPVLFTGISRDPGGLLQIVEPQAQA